MLEGTDFDEMFSLISTVIEENELNFEIMSNHAEVARANFVPDTLCACPYCLVALATK